MQPEQHTRGLQAVEDGRRKRAGIPHISGRVILWIAIVVAAWAIIYWKYTQEKVNAQRNALLARQRDAAAQLAPSFTPLRDKIERWSVEGAGPWQGDLITPEARSSNFRTRPGVYLRITTEDAKDPKAIQLAAQDSLRDAFTACLMRSDNPDPWSGPECKLNRDCGKGQHCNETHHCTAPAQPFNLRVFYRGARVLSEEWVRDVRDAGDDMRLRLLERDFDSTVKEDMPLAIELLVRGQFFVLVLDEPPADRASLPDAGALMDSIQAVPHFARVFVYDIAKDKLLLRMRAEAAAQTRSFTVSADGSAVPAAPLSPKTSLAAQRQAHSCALGMSVAAALDEPPAP